MELIRPDNLHEPLVGKLAIVSAFGVELAFQYEIMYNVGRWSSTRDTHMWCIEKSKYQIRLMFIDEPSVLIENLRFFCLKEIGFGIGGYGDWHTLDQLLICE